MIGGHRIYDGTWSSHEKYLYSPIRKHVSTKLLDTFICQKSGEKLPPHMPRPTAEFFINKTYDQVHSSCLAQFLIIELFAF
jgi:hypothetical protein